MPIPYFPHMPQHAAPPFSTRARPCPRGFREYFIENGWTSVKLEFQCQTPQVKRWMAELGADELKAARKAFMAKKRAEEHAARQRKAAREKEYWTGGEIPLLDTDWDL